MTRVMTATKIQPQESVRIDDDRPDGGRYGGSNRFGRMGTMPGKT